jgi:hypothetical protein
VPVREHDGVLLVDAANVVGSRPTGWWKDRAGAANDLVGRLRTAIAAGQLRGPVVVVLEGVARRGADASQTDGLQVVHAPGSGDDAIVSLASDAGGPVRVVTADRGLRRRLDDVGADVVGPSWLLERLTL